MQYLWWCSVSVSITRNLAPCWRVSARNAPFGWNLRFVRVPRCTWRVSTTHSTRVYQIHSPEPSDWPCPDTPNSQLTWWTAKRVYLSVGTQKLAHFSKRWMGISTYRDDLENRGSCALLAPTSNEGDGKKKRRMNTYIKFGAIESAGDKKWESGASWFFHVIERQRGLK
jgi:hypothetical protein